ncbi:MAG TPA: hypothetical protein VGU20_26195 [Stellaceae bacterium]|nr:hypothetical protein [Stellaceae bacterium]
MPCYEVHRGQSSNEWTVVDTATGDIAPEDEVLLAGLPHAQAIAVAERLNRREREAQAAPR